MVAQIRSVNPTYIESGAKQPNNSGIPAPGVHAQRTQMRGRLVNDMEESLSAESAVDVSQFAVGRSVSSKRRAVDDEPPFGRKVGTWGADAAQDDDSDEELILMDRAPASTTGIAHAEGFAEGRSPPAPVRWGEDVSADSSRPARATWEEDDVGGDGSEYRGGRRHIRHGVPQRDESHVVVVDAGDIEAPQVADPHDALSPSRTVAAAAPPSGGSPGDTDKKKGMACFLFDATIYPTVDRPDLTCVPVSSC